MNFHSHVKSSRVICPVPCKWLTASSQSLIPWSLLALLGTILAGFVTFFVSVFLGLLVLVVDVAVGQPRSSSDRSPPTKSSAYGADQSPPAVAPMAPPPSEAAASTLPVAAADSVTGISRCPGRLRETRLRGRHAGNEPGLLNDSVANRREVKLGACEKIPATAVLRIASATPYRFRRNLL